MKTSMATLKDRRDALRRQEVPELFAGELDDFESALYGLEKFASKVHSKTATDLVHELAELRVNDPHHSTKLDDYLGTWFKTYQWQYNTAVYDLINTVPGLMQKMRDVIRRDMKRTGDGPDYGMILLKEAAHAYLNFFLRPFPAWCITTPWETEELVARVHQEQAEFLEVLATSAP